MMAAGKRAARANKLSPRLIDIANLLAIRHKPPPPGWQAARPWTSFCGMPSCMALVVAAGRGTRLGGARPKQYLPLAGRPLLRHSVGALTAHPAIDRVRVVFHPDDRDLYAEAVAGLDL